MSAVGTRHSAGSRSGHPYDNPSLGDLQAACREIFAARPGLPSIRALTKLDGWSAPTEEGLDNEGLACGVRYRGSGLADGLVPADGCIRPRLADGMPPTAATPKVPQADAPAVKAALARIEKLHGTIQANDDHQVVAVDLFECQTTNADVEELVRRCRTWLS